MKTHIRAMFQVSAAIAVLAAASAVWAGADAGKAFYDEKCKACHSIAGEGGKMAKLGGPLDDVGAKRDAAWLRAYLKDPKSQIPKAKMPKMPLTDQQLDDVIAYMLTLKGSAK